MTERSAWVGCSACSLDLRSVGQATAHFTILKSWGKAMANTSGNRVSHQEAQRNDAEEQRQVARRRLAELLGRLLAQHWLRNRQITITPDSASKSGGG